jgi:uncharacterized protein YjiS (DUF1127 family)
MFATLFAPIATHFRRMELERQLGRLDDRALADIGIAREDIPLVSKASAEVGHALPVRAALAFAKASAAAA